MTGVLIRRNLDTEGRACKDSGRRGSSTGQGERHGKKPTLPKPYLRLSPQLGENTFLLFKPPSLRYFVMAALGVFKL